MHISEGVLSGPLLAGGYILMFVGTTIGLKKMDLNEIVEVGMISAVIFVSSLVHIPIGFSNAHLTLSGLAGILLGWMVFPAVVTALILQAVLFQYGGITSLGVNTVIFAVPAVFCYYFFRFIFRKMKRFLFLIAFGCGFLSVFLGGVFTSFVLLLSNNSFKEIAIVVMFAHIPVMIVEGAVTASCVSFLNKVKPELLSAYLSDSK